MLLKLQDIIKVYKTFVTEIAKRLLL